MNAYPYQRERRKSRWKLLAKCALLAAIIAAAAILFPAARCPDNALSPSVRQGDLCISCAFAEPSYNDVVLYRHNDSIYAGRIVATGGQMVEQGEGILMIDGTAVPCQLAHAMPQAETVQRDSVFIVSERESSHDSLSRGPISRNDIVGTIFWLFRCRDI